MDSHLLQRVLQEASRFAAVLSDGSIGVNESRESLLQGIDTELPQAGQSPERAIEQLIRGATPGLIASGASRYFGFVIGGTTPTALAADWLTSVWDQNAQAYSSSPAASIIEEVVAGWLLELLRLPSTAGVGFVTGAQMANFTSLAVARNTQLERAGWNLLRDGLNDAPRLRILCGADCHATVHSAIEMLGIGQRNVVEITSDDQGRMQPDQLRAALREIAGPAIVCAQAGNVNTGAFDAFRRIADLCVESAAWLHVDGAFGLWAGASEKYRRLVSSVERADSWSVDAHKWLNVPYDSGLVIVRERDRLRSLKSSTCAYAASKVDAQRNPAEWVPENSRRARGFVLYAALRQLGRNGVAELVNNACDAANRLGQGIEALSGGRLLNEVVLNQVLFEFEVGPVEQRDSLHQSIAERLQRDGRCWIGTTSWRRRTVLRASVSNWATSATDIDQALEVIQSVLSPG